MQQQAAAAGYQQRAAVQLQGGRQGPVGGFMFTLHARVSYQVGVSCWLASCASNASVQTFKGYAVVTAGTKQMRK